MDIRRINEDSRWGWLAIILAFLFAAISKFGGQPTVEDPFHTGEFVASATNLYFGGVNAYRAVLIHGLSDILPALFSQQFWGLDQHFIPTFTIYRVIDLVSLLLLIIAAAQIGQSNNARQYILILAIALIGPVLVGYRDLTLLVALNLFLFLQRQTGNLYQTILLQIAFGLSTAFGVFWSYDRGLIGTISLGLALLLCIRKNRFFLIALVAYCVSIVSLQAISPLFSLERYVSNILFLMASSAEWSYGLKPEPVILICFTVFVNTSAIVLAIGAFISDRSKPYALPNLILLCLLSVLMMKIAGINRADLMHIYQSYWVPMLILLGVSQKNYVLVALKNYNSTIIFILLFTFFFALLTPWFGNTRYVSAAVIAALLLVVLAASRPDLVSATVFSMLILLSFPFLYSIATASYRLYAGDYAWLTSLKSPALNTSLATPGVRWTAERLKETPTRCIFDMSNNGIINALAKLPTCTEFIYPVYASPKHESIMLDQLRVASPPIVVYTSTYWSYSIDGRSMAQRFPNLDKYLRVHYPFEECMHGYCVRFQ